MFGKKDDRFKYEVEVKALISEATEGLNKRIFALEVHNNQLIQRSQALEGEIYQLRNGVIHDFARLEKRITDFTDVWHPMMTANINRIKDDLVKTIMEAEREDIKKVQEDLESKMVKIVEENADDHILIGYKSASPFQIPIFVNKNCDWETLRESLRSCITSNSWYGSQLYFEKLKYLKNIKEFDLYQLYGVRFYNKNNTIALALGCSTHNFEQWFKSNNCKINDIKQIYNLCKENGIKFVVNGQDRVNGVPLKMLFEDE